MLFQKIFADFPRLSLWRLGQGILAIFFLVFLLQIVRLIAVSAFPQTLVCNAAGPWSLAFPALGLLVFGILAFLFLTIQWWRETGRPERGLWLMLLGAGASNAWERFSFGCVTDYLSLPFFPVFNVADILLTIGVLGLLWQWRKQNQKAKIKY